ncbi:pituitary tumor-transforming gene 1 protein-interacting protein [Latimeria chalumnae]|uniref:pituitary tumor-transforming gene 1 protein-interacting protein n=1 Tax=Latimeria chalumnae TaxID=7897 RepID=UPI0006D92422|nr:PREDICTED: pituitary tumor-transforming gene 1 protein-interacting protein [Latimeria chalumnae]|eukprot:XP_014347986.1 PREDICTED: pituitary tumor-transforming gene 1 protein-interacting protein [Latimeria chalumnae]
MRSRGAWLGLLVGLTCLIVAGASVTIAPPRHKPCSQFSYTTCEKCLSNVSCLWCNTNNTCMDYPVRSILPSGSICALSEARWGVCWVNFEALIIAISVVGGIILLSIVACCCCCCCRKKSRGVDPEDERRLREREERRQRSLERTAERRARHDNIRKKYGLLPDSDHPYSRFENE